MQSNILQILVVFVSTIGVDSIVILVGWRKKTQDIHSFISKLVFDYIGGERIYIYTSISKIKECASMVPDIKGEGDHTYVYICNLDCFYVV